MRKFLVLSDHASHGLEEYKKQEVYAESLVEARETFLEELSEDDEYIVGCWEVAV